jgi:hypothetical protein
MKKIVRLTESDLLRLINKVAKMYEPDDAEYHHASEQEYITDYPEFEENENPTPFNIGDVIKNKINGLGIYRVVGYKNDMIMIKPLNQEALYGMEDIQPHILNFVISKGYKPSYDRPKLIHYRYANEFEVIPQIENQ